MIPGGPSSWGGGNTIGVVYKVDKHRLGNNRSQPHTGQYALCVEHTGDCFYDYIPLVEYEDGGMALRLNKRFGAYAFSKRAPIRLTDRQFHLLMAGERI